MNLILKYPDNKLHQACTKLNDFSKAQEIAGKLIKVTKSVDRPWKFWQGMAANQIGFDKRVILIKESFNKYLVMVNPEVLEQKWLFPLIIGCYSVKGKYLTRYHLYFKIKYQDLKGQSHTKILKWAKAATLQQELDHIDGVLVVDKGIRIL